MEAVVRCGGSGAGRAAGRRSNGWQAEEVDYIEKLVGQVKAAYTVDPTRVVVFGRDTGASLALASAFRSRELVRPPR